MTLFARVAKLGSGAYGARHARVRPSIMQCVLYCTTVMVNKDEYISRQRNSGYKAEQVKYRGTRSLQFPPPFPSVPLEIHNSQKERGRAVSTLNTHLMVLRSCIGPALEAGLSNGT